MKLPIAILTLITLAGIAYAAEKSGNNAARCEAFAQNHLKAQTSVSSTTVQSSYDEKTGFCTVKTTSKSEGSTYTSQVTTNSFDPSNTLDFKPIPQPIIQVKEVVLPTKLLCTTVTKAKGGKLLCDPYKPDPSDTLLSPFFW